MTDLDALVARLRGELAEARKDTARLDKAERVIWGREPPFTLQGPTLRAALDACPETGGNDG